MGGWCLEWGAQNVEKKLEEKCCFKDDCSLCIRKLALKCSWKIICAKEQFNLFKFWHKFIYMPLYRVLSSFLLLCAVS